MKKFLLMGTAAAVFAAAPAMADGSARGPSFKDPPVVLETVSWTGCYVGANAGYAWDREEWSDASHEFASFTAEGWAGGLQAGCDRQVGNWVFGIQGMIDWSHITGDSIRADDPNLTNQTRISGLSMLTGRIGYTVQPDTLLFAKAGAAWVRSKHKECCAVPPPPPVIAVLQPPPPVQPFIPDGEQGDGIAENTRTGWAVSAGHEA